MKISRTNSGNAFKYSMYALLSLFVILILNVLNHYTKQEVFSILVGVALLFAGVFGIVGLINSIKGIKEPNTVKKVVGLIINVWVSGMFTYAIIANIFDIFKALY